MFRKEVVESQRQRLFGPVIVAQPISLYVVSIVTFSTFIILMTFLSQAQYARKETVQGYLLPGKGLVKVYSNRVGVVDTFYVKEGDKVQQGAELLKIKNSQSLSSGVELSVSLKNELTIQIQSLEQEYESVDKIHKNDMDRIKGQINKYNNTLKSILRSQSASQKRLNLKANQLNNNEKLLSKGYISSEKFDIIREEYLDILESNSRIDLEKANIETQISSLKYDFQTQPEKLLVKQALIKRKISEIKAQVTELNNQFEFIKKAPESGVITAIQPSSGTKVDLNTPILSIIPTESPLEIELLLPTRSAGFIQLGDQVKVRFDAFPYQKFGFVSGYISRFDKALVLPSDTLLPLKVTEPVYRVRAKLNQQVVKAYGKEFPLKVGMLADADIILEKRTLLEWLLDPIYALNGKLR